MAGNEVLMTLEGLKHLESDLEHLKTVRRKEIAGRIKQAIEFGDISENSEYEDAKNEQAFIEGQILNIESKLKNAKVVDENTVNVDSISEYAHVMVLNVDTKEKMEFQIVGSVEAEPFKGKISNESPVGKAVLGFTVGDIVKVNVPAGKLKLKILSISR